MTCEKEVTPSGTSTATSLGQVLPVLDVFSATKSGRRNMDSCQTEPTCPFLSHCREPAALVEVCFRHILPAKVLAIIANRFSFVFNLKGLVWLDDFSFRSQLYSFLLAAT